jgi:hypothetical protein
MSRSEPEADEKFGAWVQNWREIGPELDRIRREEIRSANTQESIRAFDLAFKAALRNQPPRETSGLVEMQRLFKKLHRKNPE